MTISIGVGDGIELSATACTLLDTKYENKDKSFYNVNYYDYKIDWKTKDQWVARGQDNFYTVVLFPWRKS